MMEPQGAARADFRVGAALIGGCLGALGVLGLRTATAGHAQLFVPAATTIRAVPLTRSALVPSSALPGRLGTYGLESVPPASLTSRQPHPVTAAQSTGALAPLATVAVSALVAVLGFRRLMAPTIVGPYAMAAGAGDVENLKRLSEDLVQKGKAQVDSAKAELNSRVDAAKATLDDAKARMEKAKAQLETATADLAPKLKAELEGYKAQVDSAKAQLDAAKAEVTKIFADDSPLSMEMKVGWLMEYAIGQVGFYAQLWLSAVSLLVALFATQFITTSSLSVCLGLAFTAISNVASWFSVVWTFQCRGMGRVLRGEGRARDGPMPTREGVVDQIWNGLAINAAGLVAALFGIEANTGLLFADSLKAGILGGTASGVLNRGITTFDVFAQLAQAQTLFSLSIGLILALIAVRVSNHPVGRKAAPAS